MSITAKIETKTDGTISVNAGERVIVGDHWYRLECGVVASRVKAYRDREWLLDMYHGNGQALKQIGETCGVSPMTINQWLVRHGIPSRPRGRRKIE